jgi:hypothetical protein
LKLSVKNERELFFNYCRLGLECLPKHKIPPKPKEKIDYEDFFGNRNQQTFKYGQKMQENELSLKVSKI